MRKINLLMAIAMAVSVTGCASFSSIFRATPPTIEKPQQQVGLRPTRENSIVGDVNINANSSDSAALLGSLAESAGFTYKQATSFKVTAYVNNLTVEGAVAQLSALDNKIAVINYQAHSVVVLNKATLTLKVPLGFKQKLIGLSGLKFSTEGAYLFASIRGSSQDLESAMTRVRRILEEDMTKVEVSLEA